VPGDIGRRYGAIGGDRNPIHLYPLTARPFGYARPIGHAMWVKARCLGALQDRLPKAFVVEAQFKRPMLLPTTVDFGSAEEQDTIRFGVYDAKSGKPHLVGTVKPY
jgi:acyl dehydratase